MIAKIEFIRDIIGANYIGVNIYNDAVIPFLEKMKTFVGDSYDEYVKNQQDRDLNHYHCTIFNVAELNQLLTKDLNNTNILNQIMTQYQADDFKMLGIGSAQKNENKAYFVVCSSEQLQAIRRRFGFKDKDLHITIGFKWKDVHGITKTKILADKEPFLEELGKYYFDFDESFNFLKELDGYDYDLAKDLFPTKIKPTYAEFRIGNEYGTADYITIALIANKLTIACKWQNADEIPYLANTLVLRKLRHNDDDLV